MAFTRAIFSTTTTDAMKLAVVGLEGENGSAFKLSKQEPFGELSGIQVILGSRNNRSFLVHFFFHSLIGCLKSHLFLIRSVFEGMSRVNGVVNIVEGQCHLGSRRELSKR
jgi:hypothetical protein